METAELTGYLATVFTAFCNFPQLLRILRRHETADLSLWMYMSLSIGLSLWVAYGWMTESWPVILANVASLSSVIPILAIVLWRRKRRSVK